MMIQTFKSYKEAEAWQLRYDLLAPKMGDEAPDFQLRDVNGQNPVRLSDFRSQKPVALILGPFGFKPADLKAAIDTLLADG